MQLSRAETERAIWLQKKLKFLRWWNKLGVFLCRMKRSPENQQELWREELQILYNKKFKVPDPDKVCSGTFGDPLKRRPFTAEEDKKFMDMFTALFGIKEKR